MNQLDIVRFIAEIALDKKAQNLVVLDVQGVSAFTDYFVICHGNSYRQVQAIATEVRSQLNKKEIALKGIEGEREGRWVLIDLGDIVVHLFHKEEREFYGLERLWGDAKEVNIT